MSSVSMKSTLLHLGYAASLVSVAVAVMGKQSLDDIDDETRIPDWHPPGPDDFRGPCPMMNTLANHGLLPHDGRNLTEDAVVRAITQGLNFDPDLAAIMFEQALVANPEPNATFFTLDHLNRHNVLEHDASLSRTDDFFGSNSAFNQTIFDQTRRYWPDPIIDSAHMANAKIARQVESKAFNPEYSFSAHVEDFSLGEMAAPFIAFGDLEEVTVDRSLVEYFFQNERLPTELGWNVRDEVIELEIVMRISDTIGNATSLITEDDEAETGNDRKKRTMRRGFHAGRHW